MYVVLVEIHVLAEHQSAFMKEMAINASASVDNEPDCHQFDVATHENDPLRVWLYEIYSDRKGFEAHLQTMHFKHFDEATQHMMARKTVHFLNMAHHPEPSTRASAAT